MSKITLYHGTPLKVNALSIIDKGLDPKGEIYIGITSTGERGISIEHKSFLSNEMWQAIKQSFVQPKSFSVDWEEFRDNEPFGYLFLFEIDENVGDGKKDLREVKENIYPVKAYKMHKPEEKFLKTKEEYLKWFKKNAVPIKLKTS